jgi:hypothetical protein
MKYYYLVKAGNTYDGTEDLEKLPQKYTNINDDFEMLFNSLIDENRKNAQLINQR